MEFLALNRRSWISSCLQVSSVADAGSIFSLIFIVCVCVCVCVCALRYVWLCDSMDCGLPGSSIHEISQARTLQCVAISFFRASSQSRDQTESSWIAGRLLHCRRILYQTELWGKTIHCIVKDNSASVSCSHLHIQRKDLSSVQLLGGIL